MKETWYGSAPLEHLQQRAIYLKLIRNFFDQRNVLEVETPILARSTIPDPNIESIQAFPFGNELCFYLQTSPEFHMKRLLATGSGAIYQLSKVFRQGEVGSKHNPEFTMLEWYQPGFDYKKLMEEVSDLVSLVLKTAPATSMSYQALFQYYLDIDPLNINVQACMACAQSLDLHVSEGHQWTVDNWLDYFMSHIIEPKLGDNRPIFIYDYPRSQAALAKVNEDNPLVAKRFELYFKGIELANGFEELTDPKEQEERFKEDLKTRQRQSQHIPPLDERFIKALSFMPSCSGVALGVDRLMMLALKASSLAEVMSFTIERA